MSEASVRHERICEGVEDGDPFLYVQRLYVQYLQGLFNFMPEGHWHWEPDQDVTEIIIRGEAPLNLQTVGKKPAITVVMGPSQFQGLGINNMLEKNLSTGRTVFTDLLSGHLVVYCLAESDVIATRLGHLVSFYTRAQRELLESPGGFFAIARPAPTMNTPSPPGALVQGDPEGLVMVQVNIPFQFQWTWSTEPLQARSMRSLDLITRGSRASDFPYTSPVKLERVELAMSTSPVLVRRISGGDAPRPRTVVVHDGQDPFQISGLRPFGEQE